MTEPRQIPQSEVDDFIKDHDDQKSTLQSHYEKYKGHPFLRAAIEQLLEIDSTAAELARAITDRESEKAWISYLRETGPQLDALAGLIKRARADENSGQTQVGQWPED